MRSLLFFTVASSAALLVSSAPAGSSPAIPVRVVPHSELSFIRSRRSDWSYDPEAESGPDNWDEKFPKSCAGKHQSPIDIPSTATQGSDALKNWTLSLSPMSLATYNVSNNGHTIQMDATLWNKYPINVTFFNGTHNDTYIFLQFHLHWGADNATGSEHTVDGKHYAAELHMVHMNAKYGNLTNALNYGDGLLVIGVFIQEGKTPYAPLVAIAPQMRALANENVNAKSSNDSDSSKKEHHRRAAAAPEKQTVSVTALTYPSIFPSNMAYWTYRQGSLTTPSCIEAVTWVVMQTPVSATSEQLQLLRSVKDQSGHNIAGNFRPTQPLNDRVVYDSTKANSE